MCYGSYRLHWQDKPYKTLIKMSNEKSRESAEGVRKIITRHREKGSEKMRKMGGATRVRREGKPLVDNYLQCLAKQTRKSEQKDTRCAWEKVYVCVWLCVCVYLEPITLILKQTKSKTTTRMLKNWSTAAAALLAPFLFQRIDKRRRWKGVATWRELQYMHATWLQSIAT